jgi:hypothetical protein
VSNKQEGIKRPCGQRVLTNSKITPNSARCNNHNSLVTGHAAKEREQQPSDADHHQHDPFCWNFQLIEMEKERLLHFGLLMKGRFQFKNVGRTSALLLTINKMAVYACDVLQMNTSDEPYIKDLSRDEVAFYRTKTWEMAYINHSQ